MNKNFIRIFLILGIIITSATADESELNLTKKLDQITNEIISLKLKKKEVCNQKIKYKIKIENEKNRLEKLKRTQISLKENISYVDPTKYSKLSTEITKTKLKISDFQHKFETYDSKCKKIRKKQSDLNEKRVILQQKLKKINSKKLEDLLKKEEWVEGKGEDILDIDESLKSCEEKAIKYAEQNAINSKYGIISSFIQSSKEININGKKYKANKNFSQKLKNLIKVVKLEEKVISNTREPVKIGNINTFICKAHVKLKVKGIIQPKDVENLLYIPQKDKTDSRNIVKTTRSYKPSRPKKHFSLGHFGGELSFGYAYNLYNFGKGDESTDALSTNLGVGLGYLFFEKVYIGTGVGIILDKVETNYNFDNPEIKSQSLQQTDMSTSFYKFTLLLFPNKSDEGFFLRGEYIGSRTQVGKRTKIPGKGYVLAFGKKSGIFGIEFRYTTSKAEQPDNPYNAVKLNQFAVIGSMLLF